MSYFLLYLPFFGRLLSILRSLFLPFSPVFSHRACFSLPFTSSFGRLPSLVSIYLYHLFRLCFFSRVNPELCRVFLPPRLRLLFVWCDFPFSFFLCTLKGQLVWLQKGKI
uniref:Putative secreted peptide n=1 Tax=Anopheles braziliensis TaxID=58242 RepID=A0A2M3ZNA3_9DIPT